MMLHLTYHAYATASIPDHIAEILKSNTDWWVKWNILYYKKSTDKDYSEYTLDFDIECEGKRPESAELEDE